MFLDSDQKDSLQNTLLKFKTSINICSVSDLLFSVRVLV